MERTYKTGRGRTSYDAGSPLLLTPYIEEKKLDEARKAAYVDPEYLLPGMDSYAGYLTVSYIFFCISLSRCTKIYRTVLSTLKLMFNLC